MLQKYTTTDKYIVQFINHILLSLLNARKNTFYIKKTISCKSHQISILLLFELILCIFILFKVRLSDQFKCKQFSVYERYQDSQRINKNLDIGGSLLIKICNLDVSPSIEVYLRSLDPVWANYNYVHVFKDVLVLSISIG